MLISSFFFFPLSLLFKVAKLHFLPCGFLMRVHTCFLKPMAGTDYIDGDDVVSEARFKRGKLLFFNDFNLRLHFHHLGCNVVSDVS